LIVWLLLLAASAALFLLVAVVAWWGHRREVPSKSKQRAERAAWARHATALAERAQRAVSVAATGRERVEATEAARAATWRALEEIEEAHEKAARKHEEAVRRGNLRPRDPSGQREVSHAALGAYRRGDLTKDQLWRVLQWSNGWDPDVDHAERELYRLRAARRAAHQRYRIAADQERAALGAAEVADVQARALSEEVATASEEAGWDDGPRAELR
jgi:hypothetical protein